MLRRKEAHGVEILLPIFQGLARQSCYDIDAYVFQTSLPKELESAQCIFNPMASSDALQEIVLERLHSNADAVHAGFQIAINLPRVGTARVDFNGDLSGCSNLEGVPH